MASFIGIAGPELRIHFRFFNPFHRHSRRYAGRLDHCLAAVWLALILALIPYGAALGQDDASGTPPPLAGEDDTSAPCFDGRLRIRDLEGADPFIPAGLDRVYELGLAWESDAQLFSLRLGCPLLETGYQLDGTFFSKRAQAFYSTATNEVRATNADPVTVPILDTSNGVQVLFVYRSLVRAGFDEDLLLAAVGGVTIRPNTEDQQFGPPGAPKGDVYFHVAILDRGQVVDLWIASKDGTIYRYETT
jgi:hypothetical protein